MSAYIVRLTLEVCKAIGCNKQATFAVWDDDTQPRELVHRHAGNYCRVHALDLIRALSRAKCSTACDDDCEQPCHEVHQVGWKRTHEPDSCPPPNPGMASKKLGKD